jgi:nucleotidyltransferase/DNA polymerase involved in DNA repair
MAKARRAADARILTDVPNVGPATAHDLRVLGIADPGQLAVQDPYALYDRLCTATATRHDPCVLDTFISAVRSMERAPPHPWWHHPPERKRCLARRARKDIDGPSGPG